jgi:DNA replication protein DnaC
MTDKTQTIKAYCRLLKLGSIANKIDDIIMGAEQQCPSYIDYTSNLLNTEVAYRQMRDAEKRQKAAHLPLSFNLDSYDFGFANGIDKKQKNQLRELKWLEQNFNILLMGPSGTGKTFIAAGLCFDAVKNGYKAYFLTMDNIINILKMKEITRSAAAQYKRLLRANLIVIDDIMLLPVTKNDAVAFFNFINHLYEKTSFIITTNKSPTEWAQAINDEVLATALLDRLLYKCEIIKLEGNSYRMKNRKTIFANMN